MRTKKIISLLIVVSLAFSLFSAAAAPAVTAEYSLEEILGGRRLKPFTLAGPYVEGRLSTYAVDDNCSAYLWDAESGGFEPVAFEGGVISGNFTELWDVSRNGRVDGVLIVAWEDGEIYWDKEMHWSDDLFDDDGAFSDAQEWRLPFGQRLLDEYGTDGAVEDYGNLIDYAALQESTYWPLHDYYNATSGDTLSMLTGFRTTQQATGWTCGPTSAVMVMDWFGLRGDLNEEDLANLRLKPSQGGATNLQQMINIFENLNALDDMGKGEWGQWDIISSYDIVDEYGVSRPAGGKYNLMSVDDLMDGSFFRELLDDGIPVMIGWNSFGGHWQVIIGYDDMGSDDTKDHVLILADPYDSTDHRNDGYNVQSLERFVYDWSAGFDTDFNHGIFIAAVPVDWDYEPVSGEGLTEFKEGYDGDGSDDMKFGYGRTAAALERYYPDTPYRGDNGLAGAATGGYERVPNDYVNVSPYYAHYDFYNMESGESPVSGGELIVLEGFGTQQQTTEWTCGLTSVLMAMEWYGANPGQHGLLNAYGDAELAAVADEYGFDAYDLLDDRLTEIDLARMRGENRLRPGATTLNDMKNIFDELNANDEYLNALALENGYGTIQKWEYLTTDDLTRGYIADEFGDAHYLEDGFADDGLIPYHLSLGHPVIIGWNEWGGHWQVIVGYDDMGTEETPDDVLILADPYDTTDHNQDGYYLEPFERLVFGWVADFDSRRSNVFIIPYLVDTGIPVNTGAKTPEAIVNKIESLLKANIIVPDLAAIKNADAFVDTVAALLGGKGFVSGADYAIADASVLDGAKTDFDKSMYGKVTLTVRIRSGLEMIIVPVTIAAKTDIPITGISTGNGQANVDFNIVSANGKGYTTYLSDSGKVGTFAPYANVNYNSKGVHIKGLTNGKTYYAYVEYAGAGAVTRSPVAKFTPSK